MLILKKYLILPIEYILWISFVDYKLLEPLEKFDLEREWMNRTLRSDALIVYEYGGFKFRNLVEVNKSNNSLDLDRFDAAKDEIMHACDGLLPRMILIDDRTHKNYNTKIYTVIRLDYSLKNFSEIFL